MHNAEFVNALKEALNGLRTVHMVGEEWVSYVGDIPAGGVPYCGQEVNRSTYSALWKYANAKGLVKSESEWQSLYNAQGGNVAYYSSGNGSSTFRMPRLVGYVRGASSQSESGSYAKEGLPNIEGRLQLSGLAGYSRGDSVFGGAFLRGGGSYQYSPQGSNETGYDVVFDASCSNSIYGNSFHVTPETSVVLYGVYAFGEVGNVDALDATTLASAVARVESNVEDKLDKSTWHIVEYWHSSDKTTWYKKWSSGWIEQGGTFVSTGSYEQKLSLVVEFSNTNYQKILLPGVNSGNVPGWNAFGYGKQTTYFMYSSGGPGVVYDWYACGY